MTKKEKTRISWTKYHRSGGAEAGQAQNQPCAETRPGGK
jgi:hypothetical protein